MQTDAPRKDAKIIQGVRISSAMRSWMIGYLDGCQNGRKHRTNSVWTRGTGNSHRGLETCRKRGLITSAPDSSINANGWRHDLTPLGRSVMDEIQPEVDRKRAEWERERYGSDRLQSFGLTEPWYGSVPAAQEGEKAP